MGSKSAAKNIMQRAGIPLVPGYHGDNQDEALLLGEAEKIGFRSCSRPRPAAAAEVCG